jgi:hypothetical protein
MNFGLGYRGLLVSFVQQKNIEEAYTKYLRLDRRFPFQHASSSSFASTRKSDISFCSPFMKKGTYIELPGEGGESALPIDEWQDLFR